MSNCDPYSSFERRFKRIRIDPEVLGHIFSKGIKHYEVIEGIPKTSQVVSCQIEIEYNVINLFIYDKSFESIPITGAIPIITTVVHDIRSEEERGLTE